MSRPTMEETALQVAEVMAFRARDPHLKVGAVALTEENRIIATSYNGLAPGIEKNDFWWQDREMTRNYKLHAEQNLCSLFSRYDEVTWVAVTVLPCPSCLNLLIAHGIQKVVYRYDYDRTDEAHKIAEFYGIEVKCVRITTGFIPPGKYMVTP